MDLRFADCSKTSDARIIINQANKTTEVQARISKETTMKFSGHLLDKHFDSTEADSPVHLYKNLVLKKCNKNDHLRCWVLLQTPNTNTSVWVDILLELPDYFDTIIHSSLLCKDEEVVVFIDFRRKGSPSPNTSPRVESIGNPSMGTATLKVEEVVSSFSSLSHTNSGFSSTTSLSSSNSKIGIKNDASVELINDKDPFTLGNVESIEEPIYLRFPNKKSTSSSPIRGQDIVLCVSLESFQKFVQEGTDARKNLIALELNRVICKDGRARNFVLTKDNWFLSILFEPFQTLQNNFREHLKCAILRENQLQTVKEDGNDLWKRVQFWVSDLLNFQSAEDRLGLLPAAGVCPFMSPYYFTPKEAKTLGDLLMPNTTDVFTTMTNMMEEKESGGAVAVCASHDIAPVLIDAFMIKKNFQKQESFKRDKQAWIKKQDKVMKKKKYNQ